jgi:hypothetical protein
MKKGNARLLPVLGGFLVGLIVVGGTVVSLAGWYELKTRAPYQKQVSDIQDELTQSQSDLQAAKQAVQTANERNDNEINDAWAIAMSARTAAIKNSAAKSIGDYVPFSLKPGQETKFIQGSCMGGKSVTKIKLLSVSENGEVKIQLDYGFAKDVRTATTTGFMIPDETMRIFYLGPTPWDAPASEILYSFFAYVNAC